MRVLAVLVAPADYTLDLIKNVYEKLAVEYCFIQGESLASNVKIVENFVGNSWRWAWEQLQTHDAFIINGWNQCKVFKLIMLNFLFQKPLAFESDTELKVSVSRFKRLIKYLWLGLLFRQKWCYGFAGGNFGHKDLFRYYGMSEDRIFLAPMQVDNKKYQCRGKRLGRAFTFGYLGRLVKVKQVDKIISALPKNARIKIVGTGDQMDSLRQLADGKEVEFTGALFGQDKIKVLHTFDCLVLFSSFEPWGLVVNEALASGIPVIVSDKVGARRDLVERVNTDISDGVCLESTGIVVAHTDGEALSKAMSQVMLADKWRQYHDNAVRRMEYWNFDLYNQQFTKWLRSIGDLV